MLSFLTSECMRIRRKISVSISHELIVKIAYSFSLARFHSILLRSFIAEFSNSSPPIHSQGVESDRCPSWHTAMENGRPIPCRQTQSGAKQSIADGLNVVRVGNLYLCARTAIDGKLTSLLVTFVD